MNHAKTCIVVEIALLKIPRQSFEESVEKHLKKDYFNYHIVYCEDLNSAKVKVEECVREYYDFVIIGGGNSFINRFVFLQASWQAC